MMSRLCLVLVTILAQAAQAADLPIPGAGAWVTDLAGVLTREENSTLEARLRDLEATDSTQVVVLIIPSLEGEVLEDYSERVATAWGIGQAGRDNGALLLIAMKERRIRIEVGYGLEGKLTDALARRIIQNEFIPSFRAGNFGQGIDAGVTAIIQAVRGEYRSASRPASERRSAARPFDWIIVMLLPLLWVLSATGMLGGMVLGGGAGMFLAYYLAGGGMIPIVAGGILGVIAGGFIGALIRAGARSPSRRRWGGGGPFIFPGGGGFSGGGFSGGGGRFGGGGSSGGW